MSSANESQKGQRADQELERELAGLRKEYERLKDERVRAEQNLANIRQQLSELETRATEDYGTADIKELTAMLDEKRAENARLVDEYAAHVRGIALGLEAVERGSSAGEGADD